MQEGEKTAEREVIRGGNNEGFDSFCAQVCVCVYIFGHVTATIGPAEMPIILYFVSRSLFFPFHLQQVEAGSTKGGGRYKK